MGGCRALKDEEIAAALISLESNTYPLRDKALFLLGLRTGFRISELLSLRICDVFRDGQVTAAVMVARKNMKKKKAARTVVLHPEAKEALKLWILEMASKEVLDTGGFLFKSRQGGKAIGRTMAWTILNRAYRACAMQGKIGTHTMRKTFAGRVHEKLGGDIFKTQKAMGHASLDSTAKYLSVDQEEIDDAILKS